MFMLNIANCSEVSTEHLNAIRLIVQPKLSEGGQLKKMSS